MSEQYKETLEQRLPEALNRIMSFAESAKHEHNQRTAKFSNGEYELVFFGSKHKNDPEDKMMDEIETEFHAAQPTLVVIEGRSDYKDPIPAKDREKIMGTVDLPRETVIRQQGEAGLAERLAAKHDLLVASPEPDLNYLAQTLLTEGYAPEDIIGFDAVRAFNDAARKNSQFPSEAKINLAIARNKKLLGFPDVPYNLSQLKTRIAELTGISLERFNDLHQLTAEELSTLSKLSDPTPWPGEDLNTFQKIQQSIVRERDRFMIQKLAEYLETYKKVFVVYGCSHLLMQEAALRYLVEGR